MKRLPAVRRFCLAVLLGAAWVFAQDAKDPFSLGREQDVAARPMALGGSYTGVANDLTALFYNPAGLSAVKRHEWLLSIERTGLQSTGKMAGFASRTLNQDQGRIQSFGYLLPIPTTRGGLTFAFGFYRPRTFSDLITFQDGKSASTGDYRYEAEGSVNHYRAGMGLDLAPDVTLGLALGYVGGAESIRIRDSGEVGYLRTYHGFDVEPALMFKITPRLRLGASLVVWERIHDLEEVYEERNVGNDEVNYRVKHPFQVKLGLAYHGNSFLVAADYKNNNWSEYRYAAGDAEILEKAGYRNENILSVGGERYLGALNTVVRAGYTYNTLPERSFEAAYDLHRFSTGLGFLFSGSISLDAAYSFAFWELKDAAGLYLENREHRFLLTWAYRY